MDKMREGNGVRHQYSDSEKLVIRMKLHQKYSINKQGFGNWIYNQYAFGDNMRILELGCGDGSMWETYYAKLPSGCRLVLTDFSDGMVDDAKAKLEQYDTIEYAAVDIQSIPYEDASFDVVIANMMLYHVPNIERALAEVRRVLKRGGIFYCATFGENGIAGWLNGLLGHKGFHMSENNSFTLQNGNAVLGKFFGETELRLYEDALEVTEISDLADYILSLDGIADTSGFTSEELSCILSLQMKDYVITIPKEYGIFLSK